MFGGQVVDPLGPAPRGRHEAAERRRLFLRDEVSPNERKRDRRLVPGEKHVERLDAERTALALGGVHDLDGMSDLVAVAQPEDGDDETSCERDLVLERAPE